MSKSSARRSTLEVSVLFVVKKLCFPKFHRKNKNKCPSFGVVFYSLRNVWRLSLTCQWALLESRSCSHDNGAWANLPVGDWTHFSRPSRFIRDESACADRRKEETRAECMRSLCRLYAKHGTALAKWAVINKPQNSLQALYNSPSIILMARFAL